MSINTLPTEPVHVTTLNEYQEISSGTAIYPGQGTPLGLCYVALKMNGEAGEFAEHVGKAMRDDSFIPLIFADVSTRRTEQVASLDGYLTDDRYDKLVKEIGDVLWYVAAAARELGITLEEAANANIRKLQDRQRRNTLQGSGDER